MGEGQLIILLLILVQITFMIVAGIEQHLEVKKLEKQRNSAIIKRKWLECALKNEL